MSGLLSIARAAYGGLLALAPARLLSGLASQPLDPPARRVARVLGVRELLQAALIGPRSSRRRRLVGVGVDTGHAASMVALAKACPDRRALALRNALTAAVLAGGGFAAARATETEKGQSPRGAIHE